MVSVLVNLLRFFVYVCIYFIVFGMIVLNDVVEDYNINYELMFVFFLLLVSN